MVCGLSVAGMDMKMNNSVVCADLWLVVAKKINRYIACADHWQVVDLKINCQLGLCLPVAGSGYEDEQLCGLC
jgi:hypothetical protein